MIGGRSDGGKELVALAHGYRESPPALADLLRPCRRRRTANTTESPFAPVRFRPKVTKGPGSRAAGIAMAYKLIAAAQARWRAVNAPHLVALVRAGAVFHKGKLLERPIDITPAEPSESTETEVA